MAKGKLVMVTGASSGFGEATARLLANEGYDLIIVARRIDRLKKLEGELKAHGSKVLSIPLDISNYNAVTETLQKLPSEFASPDILINNAGLVRGLDKVWEIKPEDWNAIIDTNVKGILNICHTMIPKMIEKNAGHIVNVCSISGYQVYPGGGVYCASKFATRALTDALRMELVASPIRVSMISPGLAETEFSDVRFYGDKEKAKKVYEGIKPLSGVDVAEAISFILSRPPHVTVGDLILYPTHQASVSIISREEK